LHSRFGTPVTTLKNLDKGVEVDAGVAERYDLAVIAEGGVFSEQVRKSISLDYHQVAWVGQVTWEGGFDAGAHGIAYERFTRHGPAALLPLGRAPGEPGARRAALVWCVRSDDDPVRELDDAQRVAVLNTVFHPSVGRLGAITALKQFPLGLNVERTLVEGCTVRIGNAAQTLHPVAGQGLNLGLRDAFELVRALSARSGADASQNLQHTLRGVEWRRAPDRWAMIVATDFLARSFTWQLPGAGAARGLGLAALQALRPARSALARQMMYGSR
jgi:2-octaprenyl-6-methoxyphenol hydroxylase